MPKSMEEQFVDLSQISTQAVKTAEVEISCHEQKVAACHAQIPAILDALIAGDRIKADEREKVAETLKDPAVAYRMLQKLAVHRNAAEKGALGKLAAETTPPTPAARSSQPEYRKQADAEFATKFLTNRG